MNRGKRIRQRLLFGAPVLFILVLSLWWQPGLSATNSMADTPKHRYVIMQTVSKDSTLEKTMGRQFFAAVKSYTNTKNLTVSTSPKPWEDPEPCKNDLACDQITINTEKRKLLFICNRRNYDEQPAPPCGATTEALFREKCIDTLPQDLPKQLWNHSKAFHLGEDQ